MQSVRGVEMDHLSVVCLIWPMTYHERCSRPRETGPTSESSGALGMNK